MGGRPVSVKNGVFNMHHVAYTFSKRLSREIQVLELHQ